MSGGVSNPPLPVVEASVRALNLTRGTGVGRVHSVFRRCFNVVAAPDDWLTVAVAPFPRVPDGIILEGKPPAAWPETSLRPGAVVRWSGSVLTIPDVDLTIRLAPTRVYDSRRRPVWNGFGYSRFVGNLQTAWSTLEAYGSPEGLGGARALLRRPDGEVLRAAADCPTALVRRAVPSLVALRRGIRSADQQTMQRAIHALLGCGIGLTPSGDDVLGGLAAGLFLGGVPETPHGFVAVLREALGEAGRTTDLSTHTLRRIVEGELADIVFDVAQAVAEQDHAAVVRAVILLVSQGATSGTETALGLCLGLERAAERAGHAGPGDGES